MTAAHEPNRSAPSAPAGAATDTGPSVYLTVWSWTERKYRIRAAALLIVNLLLFCGLCVFAHWLHVGHPFDFGPASYLEPLRFWGPQTQNLYDFILYPISVDETPVYGVVVGLLVASIVAVPISVSILYGFRSALAFCAAVLVFAHMPWMALTLVASCILAAVPPFRMQFRYASALVGLLPIVLYLYLATRGGAAAVSASISPERTLLLAGPWLLAILAACTMLAAIIFIGRVVRYRPGAVAPIIAVMFATPLVLFHAYVGADLLAYRVLESEYGPRSQRFEPVQDATGQILDFVHQRTQRRGDAAAQQAIVRALWSGSDAEAEGFKQRISNHVQVELLKDRHNAYEACRAFIAGHPRSRFLPQVLFIQARVLDTRLDELDFLGTNTQRKLYADFPHAQSDHVWSTLLSKYPESPLALAARLRVAQLRLRDGQIGGALAVLGPATGTGTPSLPALSPLEANLGFDPQPYLFEIDRLRELILRNAPPADELSQGTEPLRALAALDPHRRGYQAQLRRLAHEFRASPLYPNLVVRWADAHRDRATRIAKLRACIAAFPDDDAVVEALFQLADLEVQAAGDEATRATGLARLQRIVTEHGDSCWARLAAERLRVFGRPTTTPSQPASAP